MYSRRNGICFAKNNIATDNAIINRVIVKGDVPIPLLKYMVCYIRTVHLVHGARETRCARDPRL